MSKRRHYLTEVIPPGPRAIREARAVRDRLVREVEEQRSPRTAATVNQLLDRYLDQFDGAPRTLELYRAYVRKHISPLIGEVKVAALDAEILDSFYAELRRCRDHCSGRRAEVQHRTLATHQCDERCRPHVCRPLGATTVRHMHFILSGAYRRAVRWKWVSVSPVGQAAPPAAPTPNPKLPSAADAARIATAAWRDPDWGTLVWVAMTTGARRGELCALRWSHVELDSGREVLWLRRAISHSAEGWVEGDLKTHQQRRVALDPETVAVLTEHRDRCLARTAALDLSLGRDAFVFSPEVDGSRFLAPSSLTQRYDRLAKHLDVETTFHKLRHYSATELIAAGVDIRTVAGRLGHGGGGTTTLRAYTAWVSEADQRAARNIGGRMPERPVPLDRTERAKIAPQSPYERIAAQLRGDILAGALADGHRMPSTQKIAAEYGVSAATVHRAIELLKMWGLVISGCGSRATVVRSMAPAAMNPSVKSRDSESGAGVLTEPSTVTGRPLLDLEVRWLGSVVKKLTAEADPKDACELRQLLVDAIRREGRSESEVANYEMDIRYAGASDLLTTFVASARGT
ncbi:MAG TPA: tyrosine-type recombinase/integrase [Pseudonocardiaceae bacterium]|nr:tyrosine-type recombinase/integrase [Pseudonocardiaceae bacterium]